MAAPFIITDYKSPQTGPATTVLEQNLVDLRRLGYFGPEPPIENINGFDLPNHLKESARVIIAGSPHCHDAEGSYYEGHGKSSGAFKVNMFYSLLWATRVDQVVIITYAPSCCKKLVLWADPQLIRVMLRTKAFFRTHRPQNGLDQTPQALCNDEGDIAVLAYCQHI